MFQFFALFIFFICTNCVYSLYLSLNSSYNSTLSFQSYFAICAIVRDEPDLLEWVEYHKQMGCNKFYLTDNGLKSSIDILLKSYIEDGMVVLTTNNQRGQQLHSYNSCLEKHRASHRWIAFIDADEFIVTKDYCNIPSILVHYEKFGGVVMQWMIIGSSGHTKRPEGGILKNYWKCARNAGSKSIVNTNFVKSHAGNPHSFRYKTGNFAVFTDFKQVNSTWNPPYVELYQIMYLNHYHFKSKEDYDRNRKRGRADYRDEVAPAHYKTDHYFEVNNAYCKRNCSILQIPKVSARFCEKSFIFQKKTV